MTLTVKQISRSPVSMSQCHNDSVQLYIQSMSALRLRSMPKCNAPPLRMVQKIRVKWWTRWNTILVSGSRRQVFVESVDGQKKVPRRACAQNPLTRKGSFIWQTVTSSLICAGGEANVNLCSTFPLVNTISCQLFGYVPLPIPCTETVASQVTRGCCEAKL